ncbi:dihydrofolate reductase family protein [Nocardia iowensis]|uniref:Dihydrofolate reductase family protein n=1 Tax=Nocardia iowensis TaxID=204891 RepID=A0ABX8RH98_NOCIO|nr:dihydrofolate reductase family protein [Nocardia iowensis]QXN88948.1 dihydrofolate reductase family protein [Nocardia iowensis]
MSESAPTKASRKVAADVVVSMDGYSSTGPDDDMSWAMEHILSEQTEIYYEGIWRGASTAIVGRTNWEGFTSVWPSMTADPNSSDRTRDLGNWLATVEKVVFSRTLEQADLGKTEWRNARIGTDLETEVRALKQTAGRDILVLNSASIIQALLKADLIDDLYLTIVPVTLGGGLRLLPDNYTSTWRIAAATTFPATSAVALHYQRP